MDNLIKIFGKLTDFDGKEIPDGIVSINDAKFNAAYTTKTDEYGNYSLKVERGMYMAIVAVKDHGVNNLEYRAWNLAVFKDTEINMRIDGMEVYAINAFMIQRSQPNTSMMIYFRPMSLKRYLKYVESQHNNNEKVLNLSPSLGIDDIEVKIDGQLVNILEVNRVTENSNGGNQVLFGYLVQVTIPEAGIGQEYIKIHITLKDNETGEKGEGSLFWQKPKSFDFVSKG